MKAGVIVALRKESVDRNLCLILGMVHTTRSLSARRAWIEITITLDSGALPGVALRKESVDRNAVLILIL